MKVVITGGSGFLGNRLAARLLQRGVLTGPEHQPQQIDEIVLFDQERPIAGPVNFDSRLRFVRGQMTDPDCVRGLIDRDDIAVFHLASVVSGGGELDFDLAMEVNLDASRTLFEALRACQSCPRLVFASSIAVFGGAGMPAVVGDYAKRTPQTTYGTTKAISELLINDSTRKGYFDGRSARLPTVVIRPGKANAAASSFASAVFREPLNGIDYDLPVPGNTAIPVLGYRAIVDGLIHLHELDAGPLGDDRAVSLPSITVTAADMLEALARVAGHRKLGAINIKPDPFITRICHSWPLDSESGRADRLGFPREQSLDEIIRYYIEDYLDTEQPA